MKLILEKKEYVEDVCICEDKKILNPDTYVTGTSAREYVHNRLMNLKCPECHKFLFTNNLKKHHE